MSPRYKYPRPDLINDFQVPIVICAVLDVSGIYCEVGNEPRLLVLQRGNKVSYLKDTWSLPAGVIDNPTFRCEGPCVPAALFQSKMELAGELCLVSKEDFLPEQSSPAMCVTHYQREDSENRKRWDTFLVMEQVIRPENVYTNWEHRDLRWIPVREVLADLNCIPKPCTPNLIPDLEHLRPIMEEFQERWLAR